MAEENKKISFREKQKNFIDNFQNTTVFVHNAINSQKAIRELQIADIIDNTARSLIGNGNVKGGDIDAFNDKFLKIIESIAELNKFGAEILAKSNKTKITNNKTIKQLVEQARNQQ